MRQWIVEMPVEVHHHFGDAALRGWHSPPVAAEPKLLPQRRLHAIAVEDFPFDFGSLERFVADQLDPERVLVLSADMPESADELSGTQQKLRLK